MGGVEDSEQPPGSDCYAIEEGVISITPLDLDLTAYSVLEEVPVAAIDGYSTADL